VQTEVRLLSSTSVPPYTEYGSRALPDEPEAVDADDQAAITRRAIAHAAELRHQAYATERERLLREAAWHAAQLRNRERRLARLERRLAS
jgi:hypothetical protein